MAALLANALSLVRRRSSIADPRCRRRPPTSIWLRSTAQHQSGPVPKDRFHFTQDNSGVAGLSAIRACRRATARSGRNRVIASRARRVRRGLHRAGSRSGRGRLARGLEVVFVDGVDVAVRQFRPAAFATINAGFISRRQRGERLTRFRCALSAAVYTKRSHAVRQRHVDAGAKRRNDRTTDKVRYNIFKESHSTAESELIDAVNTAKRRTLPTWSWTSRTTAAVISPFANGARLHGRRQALSRAALTFERSSFRRKHPNDRSGQRATWLAPVPIP